MKANNFYINDNKSGPCSLRDQLLRENVIEHNDRSLLLIAALLFDIYTWPVARKSGIFKKCYVMPSYQVVCKHK